jgi:hypothetical protein
MSNTSLVKLSFERMVDADRWALALQDAIAYKPEKAEKNKFKREIVKESKEEEEDSDDVKPPTRSEIMIESSRDYS